MSTDLKKSFDELSRAIQRLHRALLMAESRRLTAETGREFTPYELLNASLNDPSLAWLRRLSTLIVDIDTLVDDAPNLGATEATAVSAKVSGLLDQPTNESPAEFWDKYTAGINADPDLVLQHARIKDMVGALRPRM